MPAPPLRPRRSLLFMPASNPRALAKGRELPADGLIFDLEDAVAPAAKEAARSTLAAALAAGGYGGRELVVRVNALDTPWGHADLALAAGLPVDAVLLPKVESADRVRLSQSLLEAFGAPSRLKLWCMIETPLGILDIRDIAAASSRLAVLVLGTSDLTKELQARPTRDRLPLVTALGLAMLAARAYRLAILDGVHLDLADEAGLVASCRQGRELGFDGKTLIHPTQIGEANAAFAPDPDEILWSRRIVEAHRAAGAQGAGVVLVDGRLIENLHVEEAHRLLALAAAIDRLGAESGKAAPSDDSV